MSSITSLLAEANSLLNSHSTHRHTSFVAALDAANEAFQLASAQGRVDLAARAELLRGHCFRGLGHWTVAAECYEKAREGSSVSIEIEDGVVVKR